MLGGWACSCGRMHYKANISGFLVTTCACRAGKMRVGVDGSMHLVSGARGEAVEFWRPRDGVATAAAVAGRRKRPEVGLARAHARHRLGNLTSSASSALIIPKSTRHDPTMLPGRFRYGSTTAVFLSAAALAAASLGKTESSCAHSKSTWAGAVGKSG
jgi:hypothetical protein